MSDIRFNQWLHQSGTGGITQVDGGHVGIGTTNPDVAVHSGNTKKINVGIVTANSIYAGSLYGDGSNLTGITQTTINSNTNNYLITGTGTANTLQGESNLTFTGKTLTTQTLSYPETTELTTEFKAGVANGNRYLNRYIKITNTYTGSAHGGIPIVWEANADGSNNKSYGSIGMFSDGAITFYNRGAGAAANVGSSLGMTEKLRIASNGNVSIGGIDPVATASAYDKASLHIHQTNSGSNKGSQVHLTTAHTGSAAGDGSQISAYATSLYINNQENGDTYFFNNGSPTATIKANGSFGIGTQAPTDKLHVNGTTNLGGNTYLTNAYVSGNIYIGGSGSANEFDDYEKGTWTPTINVGTYTTFITNTYIKIGKLVYLHGGLIFHNNSSSTAVQITNIPFTQDTTQHMGIVWLRRTTTDNKSWKMLLGENGTNVLSVHRDSNGNDMGGNLTYSQFQHSSTYFNYSITYRTTQ